MLRNAKFNENLKAGPEILQFHLTSPDKCKKMDRQRQKDRNANKGGREKGWIKNLVR